MQRKLCLRSHFAMVTTLVKMTAWPTLLLKCRAYKIHLKVPFIWIIYDAIITAFSLTLLASNGENEFLRLNIPATPHPHYKNQKTNRSILIQHKSQAFEELIILRTTLSYATFHNEVKPCSQCMYFATFIHCILNYVSCRQRLKIQIILSWRIWHMIWF